MNSDDQVLDESGVEPEANEDAPSTQPAEATEPQDDTLNAADDGDAPVAAQDTAHVSDDPPEAPEADEPAAATAGAEADAPAAEAPKVEAEEADESAAATANAEADVPAAEAEEVEAEEADEATAETDAADDEALSDEALFLAALDGDDTEGFKQLRRGEIITGTIVSKSPSEIMVDVGVKSEGLIAEREMQNMDEDTLDALEVGSEVNVYVLVPESKQGHVILSLNRAKEAEDWEKAEAYLESEEIYETEISGFNKGGLLAQFGRLRGFIPASQVGASRQRRSSGSTPQERWGEMVGDDIAVKVIEVDQGRNRLILSERAAMRDVREERRAELIDTLEEGQVLTGRVVRLTDFGAFVDVGGADGLVHLSELAWQHVNHPKEVLKVGDEIKVEVISLDEKRQRIGLSRKRCLDDPWESIAQDYSPDELVQGKVTKLTKFGAFARLVDQPAIEGLIHISELADHRVNHPGEVVEEGDLLTLRIIRIEPERQRLGLSLKRVDSEEYLDDDWESLVSSLDDESDEDDA